MEVSFKFNNGETGQEMAVAIMSLFSLNVGNIAAVPVTAQGAIINAADNPATGGEPEDTGPVNNATHDTEGSPWDSRIHSDKRTVTDKGVWRKRKGVPPQAVQGVQAELRAAGKYAAIGNPPAAAPIAPPPAPAAAPLAPATVPTMPAMPGALPGMPALAPVESAYTKFATFVASNLNSAANPQGRLTGEWVAQALASMGYAGTDGVGYMALLEKEPAEKVLSVHTAFANALGVAV